MAKTRYVKRGKYEPAIQKFEVAARPPEGFPELAGRQTEPVLALGQAFSNLTEELRLTTVEIARIRVKLAGLVG